MKVEISKIDVGDYSVREDFDEEHLEEIRKSLEQDGQWNRIKLRTAENGNYKLIAGHYRLQAAKELGWDEIEVNVEDVDNEEADLLSIKTNMLRKEMEQREMGEVLVDILEEYELSQRKLADKLGKSKNWVNTRVRLALDLHSDVVDALEDEKISSTIANVIGGLDKELQPEFMEHLISRNTAEDKEAREPVEAVLKKDVGTIFEEGRG